MMTTNFATAERFRAWTAEHLGLSFDETKLQFLAALMAERAAARGVAANDYLDSLEAAPAGEERRSLIAALTVPETYFFRHTEQFEAFREVAVPQALTAAGAAGNVRILCAGCASGEEPYSLVMWMRKFGIDGARIAPIHAVDLNPAMLRKAVAARYSSWALRETPAPLRERWFECKGGDYLLADPIRAAVQFEELNLADLDPGWWQGKSFEVIFCRNVLMYFTRDAAARALERLTRALVPGGYLFMGHAETLRGISDEFELCHSHGAFYYRRHPQARRSAAQTPVLSAAPDPVARQIEPTAEGAPVEGGPAEGAADLAQRVRSARQLLAEERFSEAISALEPLPVGSENAQLRLLRAALLTHAGRLADAERECGVLLAHDAREAGAHYLLALCRDGAHDRAGASEHDRKAMALAPRFALPPLHLGLMARRVGDHEDAARQFELARELLQTEDDERLLLYGGGFSRAALVSLCGARPARSPRKTSP